MMRRVTVKAVYVAVLVGRAQKIAVLFSVLMAGEAGSADFICRSAFERDDFRWIAARLHVLPARAMARLALPGGRGGIALVKCDLPVWGGSKALVEVSMAILAAFRAHVYRRQLGGCRLALSKNEGGPANATQNEHKRNLVPERGPNAGHD